MSSGMIVDSRKEFEEWADNDGYINLNRNPDGSYESAATECAWDGWQARASLSAVQQPEDVVRAVAAALWDKMPAEPEEADMPDLARAALAALPSQDTEVSDEEFITTIEQAGLTGGVRFIPRFLKAAGIKLVRTKAPGDSA